MNGFAACWRGSVAWDRSASAPGLQTVSSNATPHLGFSSTESLFLFILRDQSSLNFVLTKSLHIFLSAGDWLQGPYVYALYQHYGYTTGDIGKLFIAGFGSSMVFGTIVGSLGDRL
jgi:hypothetical protein